MVRARLASAFARAARVAAAPRPALASGLGSLPRLDLFLLWVGSALIGESMVP